MTLTVETGSGLANADSYASTTAADTRLAALGNTTWGTGTTATSAGKEAALRRATVRMQQAYRQSWKGQRISLTQALDWPRAYVTVDELPIAANVVPVDVVNACIDLAAKAAILELTPDTGPQVVRKKIGPLETEYAPHGQTSTEFTAIDLLLAPYLKGSGAMASVLRT